MLVSSVDMARSRANGLARLWLGLVLGLGLELGSYLNVLVG